MAGAEVGGRSQGPNFVDSTAVEKAVEDYAPGSLKIIQASRHKPI